MAIFPDSPMIIDAVSISEGKENSYGEEHLYP